VRIEIIDPGAEIGFLVSTVARNAMPYTRPGLARDAGTTHREKSSISSLQFRFLGLGVSKTWWPILLRNSVRTSPAEKATRGSLGWLRVPGSKRAAHTRLRDQDAAARDLFKYQQLNIGGRNDMAFAAVTHPSSPEMHS